MDQEKLVWSDEVYFLVHLKKTTLRDMKFMSGTMTEVMKVSEKIIN